MNSKKYPMLNDSDWLRKRYVEDGASTLVIGREVGGCNPNLVRQALAQIGITTRDFRQGQVHNRIDDGFVLNVPVITGTLLGDAGLKMHSKRSSICAPHYYVKHADVGHVRFMASLLFDDGGHDKVTESTFFHSSINRMYTIYGLRSYSHDSLRPFFKEWYPDSSGYKKVIPSSIEVDEIVLLHWFMDDGSSYQRKGYGRRSQQIVITFCSEGFLKDDQEMLCQKINDKFDLGFKVTPYNQGTGWRINLPQSKTDEFFEVIGPTPVPSLAYKWKASSKQEPKYPLLRDSEWLYQRHIVEGASETEIACELGASGSAVVHQAICKLKDLDWAGREGVQPVIIRPRKYPQLGDADWLYQRYIVEELSVDEIASIIGCGTPQYIYRFIGHYRRTAWAGRPGI